MVSFLIEASLDEFTAWYTHRHEIDSRRIKSELLSKYARKMLKTLDIRLEIINTPDLIDNGLIVSNHISYVDILVIASIHPSLFITSVEVKNSAGIGWITRLAGCLFVERRSRQFLDQETGNIESALRAGTPIVLFPEGTTTDGSKVLPFRPALFQSAVNSGTTIHQFCIQYSDPSVAYYGNHEFIPHLLHLCRQKKIWARIHYLGESRTRMDADRKDLAHQSYERVLNHHVFGI